VAAVGVFLGVGERHLTISTALTMGEFPTITKLEAANRQLCAAIRLFFADGDAVAVHTLACAAREIYEKHCRTTGRGRMFDFVQSGNSGHAERDLWNILNAARNFFKHEGTSLSESIEFEDSMNDFVLLTACTDCATLCSPHQPPEVQAYSLWYLGVETPDDQAMAEADPAEANAARAIQQQIDQRFPGLRAASRAEKKRFGARLLDDAVAGRLVEHCDGPEPSDVELSSNLYLEATYNPR